MYIRKIETEEDCAVVLNPSFKKLLHIIEGEKIFFNFGSLKKEVQVRYSRFLEEDVMEVSANLMQPYTVPDDLDFDWYMKGRELFVGPVLGIIRGSSFNKITNYSLKILLRWVTDYRNIKGLVIVFPLSEVQPHAKFVRGYAFHPHSGNGKWVEGIFPFPTAVFNRPVAGGGDKYRLLEQITEGRFFNSKGTGKWEFYSALSKRSETSSLVPYTEKYRDAGQLLKLLDTYQVLYLKRRFGARGYGIIQVRKEEDSIEVTNVVKGKQNKEKLHTEEEAEQFFSSRVKKNRYIIQQGVPFESDGKQVDFRGYLQKDAKGFWKLREYIGRRAKRDSVITNLRYTEKILPGQVALREFYGYDDDQIKSAAQKIEKACIQAGESLDQHLGHFGDLALDFILDSHGKVYFLEVNGNYGHTSLQKLNNTSLKEQIYKSPLEYAKYLSGFSTHAQP
ncbi:YheC/YheD family protein [Halobacillus halophilus]|uniref:YheC/YheD family endospore coat-associated protein n=1 Tax=Halobacillus halophilus TaxID=1570 RepID=UPI001CD4E547|nr:YheC/YheD family protein [Halobacillus halophilus]MCA1011490.1 YheC/YheD family protein [Halobacillus halophilus]